ncbi:hypothetical protein RFI_00569 [Reticulomyxa filosa]|uniref:Uncharacterized protein n=1 Tax=Reticulomyxa filosa TaxID=46433 RepID=X6PFN6_RETFI|nr:hypothetical protein RFI_00569 [Reticulomyxa filosa]|eukprot:ETO36492.1 hypothetical protein RFI_00569 [Reticulomyxa filosa]
MEESKKEEDTIEKRIHIWLKDEAKIDAGEALKIASYLHQTLKLTEKDDIVMVEPKEWKSMFAQVELATISKKKLLKLVNAMREKAEDSVLDIKDLVDCVSRSKDTFKFSFLQMRIVVVAQTTIKRNKNKLAFFNVNDERWKMFGLKAGDEILCRYTSDPNHALRVDSIERPPYYESNVNEDDESQFVSVRLHSSKTEQPTKVKIVGSAWRVGDKVKLNLFLPLMPQKKKKKFNIITQVKHAR